MAGYRRFFSYIYEYLKGKKGANCGFVRVEEREHVCRMEFHICCEGLIPENRCEMYGFVRNKGLMDSSLLGQCMTQKDKMEYVIETDSRDMGTGGFAAEKLAGLILLTENGGFFGTEWDDQPIRPENFHPVEKSEKHTEVSETKPDEPVATDIHVQSVEAPAVSESIPSVEPNSESESAIKPEEPALKSESDQQSESIPERIPKQNANQSLRPLPGTPWEAFEDGEMTECRKINLDDLRVFGRKICMLRNNRFVQYGYYNFGHLLACRNRSGQYILGIPGCYDQQERFMANMFGFPYFKDSHQIRVPRGRGGYWYRSVDAPDFN